MKQILILITMGLVMIMAAGCTSPAAVNTPLPTSVPTSVATPYTASPIVSYYPTQVQTNNTANYKVTGSVFMNNGVALNGYTVALTCNGINNVSDQYFGLTDANGSYVISFTALRGHYDNFSVTVISPTKQLVYQDRGTRVLAGNETADIKL